MAKVDNPASVDSRRPSAFSSKVKPKVIPDISAVEREIGELPGSVREALLAFCEGRRVRQIAVEAFGRRPPRAEVDAVIARLDELSFDEP